VTGRTGTYCDLIGDRRFCSLLASKLATRIARDALLYALLIRVVQETGSTRNTTFLVLAFTIPSVLFGLAAGAVAEAVPLRPLLVAGHLSRGAIVGTMLAFGSNVWGLYALLIGFSTVGLFVGPAESSALPRLVRQEDRSSANSLVSFTGMAGTMLGAVALGPVVLAVAGWGAVVAMSAALHLAAAVAALGTSATRATRNAPATPRAPGAILLHGWRAIQTSPDALLVFGYLMIAASLGKVIVALAPYYTREVLGINPEKMVYIAAPAAIGAAVSLVMTAVLSRSLGLRRTVDIGFFVLLLGLVSVAALAYSSDFVLTQVNLHVGWVEERVGSSPIIVITMIVTILVGFGTTMLGIAGTTTLNQEVPAASQARAFSTRTTLSDAVSLVPLFAVASVADRLGVRVVLLVVTLAALIVALILRASHRRLSRLALVTDASLPPVE
jgi:MFS family permease